MQTSFSSSWNEDFRLDYFGAVAQKLVLNAEWPFLWEFASHPGDGLYVCSPARARKPLDDFHRASIRTCVQSRISLFLFFAWTSKHFTFNRHCSSRECKIHCIWKHVASAQINLPIPPSLLLHTFQRDDLLAHVLLYALHPPGLCARQSGGCMYVTCHFLPWWVIFHALFSFSEILEFLLVRFTEYTPGSKCG